MGQVVSQRELLSRRGDWKSTGKGVVCAYGAFDLLHPGHVRLLEQARDYGDILVAVVQSDRLARRLANPLADELVRTEAARADGAAAGAAAGVQRPVNPAEERAELLAALASVDYVVIADEPLEEFLKQLRPDAFVCGSDSHSQIARRKTSDALEYTLEETGCQIVRLPQEPGYSTSGLIERIAGLRA